MAGRAKCAFSLLIAVDVRLCQICFRAADRAYTALVDTTMSSSSVFAWMLGVDMRLCLLCFALLKPVKSRARLCLRELVLLIAVDIQWSEISFRFAGRGYPPLCSTPLCRLEGPSLCCMLTYDWAGCIFLCRYWSRRSRWVDRG